jgi:protocatechuate 3,4-dioxygenase beta subunit
MVKLVQSVLSRREMIALLGAAGAAQLAGCSGGPGGFSGSYTQQTIAGCVVSPDQTEGPFFVDEKLNRSDLRVDPSNGSVSPGVPLRLTLFVSQIKENSCTPLPGATVDVWHCDSLGSYSDVRENASSAGDTRGRKFLRGYQVTDAQGRVEFQTIYPGWYEGRMVHVHYKIRTDPRSEVGYELTSQLYFDEAITDAVHAQGPYSQKGKRDTTNSTDGIFRRGGNDLMLALTKEADGYSGGYKVGLWIA